MKKKHPSDESVNLDRRAFFRRSIDKTTEKAVKSADAAAKRHAKHWIRPPWAIDELEFLLACTRCGACTQACPHEVIFPLSPRLGVKVVATPAMDILNKGCHLCTDWPCVTVCEPRALRLPEQDSENESVRLFPRMATARILSKDCLPYSGPECGACNNSCPVPGALTWNMAKPVIQSEKCVGCGLCREACIVEPKAISIQTL